MNHTESRDIKQIRKGEAQMHSHRTTSESSLVQICEVGDLVDAQLGDSILKLKHAAAMGGE